METAELVSSAVVRRDQGALKELVCLDLLLTIPLVLKCCLVPSPGWPHVPPYERSV